MDRAIGARGKPSQNPSRRNRSALNVLTHGEGGTGEKAFDRAMVKSINNLCTFDHQIAAQSSHDTNSET
jgi:hypothetical protein